MKIQYDLEGGQLSRSRWYCSKLLLGAVLLVGLMLGSAFATICFQRYWEAVPSNVPLPTTTTVKASQEVGIQDERHGEVSTDQPTTVEASTEFQNNQEITYIEINLDDQGLQVNVNQDNGSLLSITEASSDFLKEFAGLVMAEAFAAMLNLQEVSNAKHVDIPELAPVVTTAQSTEEIWSWSTQPGHDGFRIRFDNGEWNFEAVSREEIPEEEKSSESKSEQEPSEQGVEQISTEAPEEVWSWSSQGVSGFRISFTDGKWSFEAVSRESEEDGDRSEVEPEE